MSDYLVHYGIRGQKHGDRRYQNYDGSLTPLGRIRYGVGKAREIARDTRTVLDKKSKKPITSGAVAAVVRAKYKAGKAAQKARERASSKAYEAKVFYGRPALRKAKQKAGELSYAGRMSINKVNRFLSANSAEAARLRSYVDSDRFKATKRAILTNLQNQKAYKARRVAGINYLAGMNALRRSVEVASDTRSRVRDEARSRYNYMSGYAKATLARTRPHWSVGRRNRNAAYDASDWVTNGYSDAVSGWNKAIKMHRNDAMDAWRRARGR